MPGIDYTIDFDHETGRCSYARLWTPDLLGEAMKTNWMKALSTQYRDACDQFPNDQHMIIFDIDGSILDMRYMILRLLQAYDQEHASNYFEGLDVSQITVHENQVVELLEQLKIVKKARKKILDWFGQKRWTSEAIHEMHRPFDGVLDVIRWFQIQPNTSVGLVTGRPETLREDTLRSLNRLGKPYRVVFEDKLLYMNHKGWGEEVPDAKVSGLKFFTDAGYHVFAFIDNEPTNLKALAKADADKNVLLLHANTIFESVRTYVPRGTARGKDYRLSELVQGEKLLPSHVQLVWHGVNDAANLRQFLASDVHWLEVDLRLEPGDYHVILRHDSFEEVHLEQDEDWLTLPKVLKKVKSAGRAIKLDLKTGERLVDEVLRLVSEVGLPDDDLWFNGNIERLKKQGFEQILKAHPKSIIQCPIDFLIPLLLASTDKSHETLEMFRGWGINRFSISWEHEQLRSIFDQMDLWGYEVNIYNVPDLESFLKAAYLMPRSVTSDFNFPQWHYYGRGPRKKGGQHDYKLLKSKQKG